MVRAVTYLVRAMSILVRFVSILVRAVSILVRAVSIEIDIQVYQICSSWNGCTSMLVMCLQEALHDCGRVTNRALHRRSACRERKRQQH